VTVGADVQLRALFAREGWSEYIFDAIPTVLFYVKDRAGRYVSVNDTVVRRSGLARKEDALGFTADELFPGLIRASNTIHDAWVMANRTAIRDKLMRYVQHDGTPIWCLSTKVPLLGDDDEVIGLVGISRDLPRPDDRELLYRRVAGAVEYMENHFGEPLRIPTVAARFELSADTLERAVRAMLGLTPKQLLMKLRLEAATKMLTEQSDAPVAQIAYACGYPDQSGFARQFKAVLNVTPVEYRRLMAASSTMRSRR
jgi:AraC-like DNA-binding protein